MGCPDQQFLPKIEVLYRDKNGAEWGPHENEFGLLPSGKMNVADKVDKKVGLFIQLPCFLPELWYLNCPKSAFFLQFCGEINKKPEPVQENLRICI